LREHFKALGKVDLTAISIGRDLDCNSGQFFNGGGSALTAYCARIGGNVSLHQVFAVQGKVEFRLAVIGKGLDCSGGHFTNGGQSALEAESMSVQDSVLLNNGFIAEGKVNLQHVIIGIGLYCDSGQFTSSHGLALDAESARIGGGGVVLNDRFKAGGEVRLGGAKIDGDLNCRGGRFRSSQKFALDANSANIGGDAFLNDQFQANGGVELRHATIGGDLNCDGGQFFSEETNHAAIDADSVGIGGKASLCADFYAVGTVTFKGSHVAHDFELRDRKKIPLNDRTILDLQFARVGVLFNQEESWPQSGNLRLQGFVYDVIHSGAKPDAYTQVRWVQTQNGDFISQPYEQLAATLRGMGLQEQALQVMMEENKHAGRDAIAKDSGWKALWDECWYGFFGKLIGYGYQPWNALYLSFGFVVLGAVVFKIGHHKQIVIPTGDKAWVDSSEAQQLNEAYPKFNALIYSLEAFVPLVKLAVEDHWIPNANRGPVLVRFGGFRILTVGGLFRCYLWIHILAGWILTTLWVGAFTGLLKT
jgi:hypothetical protein